MHSLTGFASQLPFSPSQTRGKTTASHNLKNLNNKVKIHREGTNILILLFLVLGVLNIPVWLFMPPYIIPAIFSAISIIMYLFVFNFFRCPLRHYAGPRKNMVISSVAFRIHVATQRTCQLVSGRRHRGIRPPSPWTLPFRISSKGKYGKRAQHDRNRH